MKEKLKNVVQELNEQQQKALLKTINGGHVVVMAVPGSGKTKTIASTVATMVATGKRSEKILVLTFTKKAADELRDRIEVMLDKFNIISRINVYTFHSIALRMLKKYGPIYIPILKDVKILDENRQKRMFDLVYDKMVQELDENNYFTNSLGERDILLKGEINEKKKEAFDTIKRNKTFDINLLNYKQEKNIEYVDLMNFNSVIATAWEKYETTKSEYNSIDFDDILIIFKEMLKSIPEFRDIIKDSFTNIIVDEFQDSSSQQIEIINLIKKNNLTVVGDDAQTIYSWRNADVNLIKNFKDDYDATLVSMELNYRSNDKINFIANSIIENNKNRVKKEIKSIKTIKETDQVDLKIFNSEKEEALFIAEKIEKEKLGTVAVLYRNHKIAKEVEEIFKEKGILFNKKGTADIFHDWEIRQVIEYLNVYINDTDANILKLMLTRKGVGEKTIDKIKQTAYTEQKKILEVAKEENKTKEFTEKLEEYMELKTLDEMFEFIEKNFIEKKEESSGNLKGFKKIMVEYLDNNVLNIKQDTFERLKNKIVNMMTIHSSKGLEFDTVFIIGLEEGIFPSVASLSQGQIEEERRLFFVAITRARDNLFMSCSRKRNEKKLNLSSFLAEIKGIELGDLNKLEANQSKVQEEMKTYLAELIGEMEIDI